MTKIIPILIPSLILTLSCGGTNTDYIGTWELSSYTANGSTVSTTGISNTQEFGETKGTTTFETDDCKATVNDFSIAVSDDQLTTAGGDVECEPSDCVLSFTVNGADSSLQCPDDLETNSLTNKYEVDGSTLTLTYTLNDVEYVETYLKQ